MNTRAKPPANQSANRPLLAFALSGLMIGLGQLYAGQPVRALVFFIGFSALQFSVCMSIYLAAPSAKLDVFVAGLGLLVSTWILSMLDAWARARKQHFFDTSRFNRRRVGFGFFVVGTLLAICLVRAERLYLIDVYRVSSTSMSPTLRNGDYVLVNRQTGCIDCVNPLCAGDIVVFENGGLLLIKRVVGLPGETVGIQKQILSVNGQPVTGKSVSSLGEPEIDHFHRSSSAFAEQVGNHEYLSLWDKADTSSMKTERIPPDTVFVLGDNRHHAKDSRQLGAVPLSRVRGRVEQIWFSRDDQSGTRPQRAGVALSSGQCEDTRAERRASETDPLTAATSESLPNLLIITIDTLRVDHVGAYGHAKARTEAIDRVAEVSVRFQNAVTPFPRTTPALASLFTGLFSHHHGSRDVGIPIKRGRALAEVLKEQGYETHAVTSTALASSKQHFDRGFDDFDERTDDSDQLLATDVTKRALEMIRMASRTSPQFLWVHYFDPHFPYAPPRGFANQPEASACRQLIRNVLQHPRVEWNLHSNWGSVAERTRSDCLELYDAEIHYTDTEIARLLHGLSNLGFLESVMIVITSDHGESFGESGTYYEHGATVHDAVVRIPLLIAAPGLEARVEPLLFSLEDLMPTLLGLLDIDPSARPPMDGSDYSKRLQRPSEFPGMPERVLFAEGANANKPPLFALPFDAATLRRTCTPGEALESCDQFGGAGELLAAILGANTQSKELPEIENVTRAANAVNTRFRKGEARQRSVRTRSFKLVQAPKLDGGIQRTLFDLAHDPDETTDVSARHPEVWSELGRELDLWLASVPKMKEQPLDPEDIEVLRRLGYVE